MLSKLHVWYIFLFALEFEYIQCFCLRDIHYFMCAPYKMYMISDVMRTYLFTRTWVILASYLNDLVLSWSKETLYIIAFYIVP